MSGPVVARVDVIVPAFNAEATLGPALASIAAQSDPDFRALVIDDGSTDGTAEVAAGFAAADPRFELVRQANGGIVAAMNAGLARATAPFVARLDADDEAAPDRHAMQLACFDAEPDTVAVSGAQRTMAADGRDLGRVFHPPSPGTCDFTRVPALEPLLPQPFMMARRAALAAVGGYRPLPVSEDSDLYWRMRELGRLRILPEVVGTYRLHAGSVSGASIANGRLMAVASQVAALSARRRADGRRDLIIDERALGWKADGSLARMVARAADDLALDPGERRWLAAAAAAKLMEFAGYRPFELAPEDCAFIGRALAAPPELPPGNLRELGKMRAASAARLLRAGRGGDATRLAGLRLWPQVAVRAGLNRLYWQKKQPA